MYTINDMPSQIGPGLVERLERVETATVGHFVYDGFIDRSISALLPDRRIFVVKGVLLWRPMSRSTRSKTMKR